MYIFCLWPTFTSVHCIFPLPSKRSTLLTYLILLLCPLCLSCGFRYSNQTIFRCLLSENQRQRMNVQQCDTYTISDLISPWSLKTSCRPRITLNPTSSATFR
ncbi:hypothetical protein GGS21DRAFT_211347 [Xylaria nigripes]|nr:hypothetical protein GGS21DRAFT_211347 [Xylaria nigripes]